MRAAHEIDGQLVSEVSEEVRETPMGPVTTRKLKLVSKESMIRLLVDHFGLTEKKLKLDVTQSLADVLTQARAMEGNDGDGSS